MITTWKQMRPPIGMGASWKFRINGGAFVDILDPAAGGTFVTGGYNAIISDLAPVIRWQIGWPGVAIPAATLRRR